MLRTRGYAIKVDALMPSLVLSKHECIDSTITIVVVYSGWWADSSLLLFVVAITSNISVFNLFFILTITISVFNLQSSNVHRPLFTVHRRLSCGDYRHGLFMQQSSTTLTLTWRHTICRCCFMPSWHQWWHWLHRYTILPSSGRDEMYVSSPTCNHTTINFFIQPPSCYQLLKVIIWLGD